MSFQISLLLLLPPSLNLTCLSFSVTRARLGIFFTKSLSALSCLLLVYDLLTGCECESCWLKSLQLEGGDEEGHTQCQRSQARNGETQQVSASRRRNICLSFNVFSAPVCSGDDETKHVWQDTLFSSCLIGKRFHGFVLQQMNVVLSRWLFELQQEILNPRLLWEQIHVWCFRICTYIWTCELYFNWNHLIDLLTDIAVWTAAHR